MLKVRKAILVKLFESFCRLLKSHQSEPLQGQVTQKGGAFTSP